MYLIYQKNRLLVPLDKVLYHEILYVYLILMLFS
jgi:hypothetical protein